MMIKLPLAIFYVYLTASIITFIAYVFDQAAAQNNRWRIRERTLHLFALLGGWPGAWLAQKVLRHKSKKVGFQTVFWITVVMNCALLGWILTKNGLAFL